MAVLPDTDRHKITVGLMRYWSKLFEEIDTITKAQFRTFVNETDGWINDNRNSYATSMSEPAASELTGSQQALVFAVVAIMRKGDIELLKRMLQVEVD